MSDPITALDELRAYIRSKKAALAGFMELGAKLELNGDSLRVEPLSDIYVRYLNDNKDVIAALATEYCDRPIVVELAALTEADDDRAASAAASSINNQGPEPVPEASNGDPRLMVFCTRCDKRHTMDEHDSEVRASEPAKPRGDSSDKQTRKPKPKADPSAILRTLKLFTPLGGIIEIRALGVDGRTNKTTAGYYDSRHLDEAAADAAKLSARSAGVYFTINEVDPAVLARAANRLINYPKQTTSDGDIKRRRILFIDFDADRPSGVSATDAEKALALQRKEECREFLTGQGWPMPLVDADSGNGGHLDYLIDLANDPDAAKLLQHCLQALDAQFSHDGVSIDQTTFNAARICRLYGTVAAKGDHVPDRPHRVSTILEANPESTAVSIEQFQELAALALEPEPQRQSKSHSYRKGNAFDGGEWIQRFNVPVKAPTLYEGGLKWLIDQPHCIFGGPHDAKGNFIIQMSNGAMSAGCKHNSCQGKDWRALRLMFEPDAYSHANDAGSDDFLGEDFVHFEDDPWPEPIPLDQAVLPDLPADILPSWARQFADAVAASTETPRALAMADVLGVIATANQGKFIVEVKTDYTEPLNIWVLPALPSGHRKTAVLLATTKPLVDYETELREQKRPEIKRLQSDHDTLLAQIQKRRSAAGSMKGEAFEKEKAAIANLELELPEVPEEPQLWTEDTTPEKLATDLADQGGVMSVISDEAGFFDILAGRYSGGVPNLDVVLKAHSGSFARARRRSRKMADLPAPALTVILSPQPDALIGLAADDHVFRRRGLVARFAYFLPPSTLGERTGDGAPIPVEISSAYDNGVCALLRFKTPNGDSLRINLSRDAYQEWKEFARAVEAKMKDDCQFEHCRDWAGKLPGLAIRFAGNLHCADHKGEDASEIPASVDTMRRALDLAGVAAVHALAAFDLMGGSPALKAARKLLRWIERECKPEFTFRDAHRALRGTYAMAEDLEPAFKVLIERFHIEELPRPARPGRPQRTFAVNPQLTGKWGAR